MFNRRKRKLCFLFIFISLMSVEYLTYYLQTLSWLSVECFEQSPGDKCVKFLLVADPQIVGEALENSFNSFFSQWDSDRSYQQHIKKSKIKYKSSLSGRFLKRTFSYAMHHTRPDAVIFLGDLMDEGSIATADEYERYVKRFHWTFPETAKHIYLPGDNDIGGEGDPITYQKINNYAKHFGQAEVMKVKGVTFYKV